MRRKYGTEKRSAAEKQNKRKRAGTKAGTARFFVVSFREIKYTIGNKKHGTDEKQNLRKGGCKDGGYAAKENQSVYDPPFFEDEITEKGEKVDNRYLFDGLKITECGEKVLQHQQQYPVIFLTLKSAKQPSFEMAYAELKNVYVKKLPMEISTNRKKIFGIFCSLRAI